LIYRTGYIWFSSFIIFYCAFSVWFYCVPMYTLGSYSYWIVWLLFPPFLLVQFYCVYNSYTLIRSFAALHHLNFAGNALEFYLYWHMVAWIITISVDIYHLEISLISQDW